MPEGRRTDRWRERIVEQGEIWHLLGSASPGSVVSLIALSVARGLTPASLSVAIGVLIARTPAATGSRVSSPEGRGLLMAVGWVAGLVLAERVLPPLVEIVRLRTGREIDGGLRQRTFRILAGRSELAQIEEPAVQDGLATARGGLFGTAGDAATSTIEIAARYLQTLSSLAVIGSFSAPMALVLLVVIVVIRQRWHAAFADLAGALMESAGKMRRSTYFSDLVLTPVAAKEVRIFGLLDWFVARQRQFWGEATEKAFEVRRSLRRQANLELAVLCAAYAATTVLAARATARGDLGLGQLAAVLQCQFWAAQLIAPTVNDYAGAGGVAALRSVEELERRAPRVEPATVELPEASPVEGVVVDHVTFGYAGASRNVFDDFSLEIPSGRSTAIVGANGAGKTTLLKLLCGLYVPDQGRVTVDGVDLRGVDPATWRTRISAVFQDFNRYELSASDNVLFGAWGRADQDDRDRASARAGADAIVEALPLGWETVLSRQYEGGAELSGGQWQRIAVARALVAVEAGASVLVLDEPTANLDVRAETELFERLLEVTEGMTTVLVSHRFSSVRKADRIVVIDKGRVVEAGSHAELMARGGEYARMFTLQARQFLEDAAEPTAADREPTDA
jgi:ATP-binding cassette, subfamily B, bacterial